MDIVNRRSYVRYCSDILVRSLVCIYVLYNIHQQHNVCCLCIVIAVKENTPMLNFICTWDQVELSGVRWSGVNKTGVKWNGVGWGATQ